MDLGWGPTFSATAGEMYYSLKSKTAQTPKKSKEVDSTVTKTIYTTYLNKFSGYVRDESRP